MTDPTAITGIAPFEPHRFASTVAHYVANRPRYPRALLQLVLDRFGLKPGARVLDLGCGPGFLAIGFAELGCQALGLDPSPDMLTAAHEEAKAANVAVDFRQGSSYDLGTLAGPFDLCVMGRSFHWMDRPATLTALDRLIAPGGGVALLGDRHIDCPENVHDTVLGEVRDRFGTEDGFRALRKSSRYEPDEVVLMASPFRELTRFGVIERRPLTADGIVGRGLSLSNTSPEKLGEQMALFEAELRRRLAELSPSGMFSELIELTALVAARPA